MYFKSILAGLLLGIGFIIPLLWWCAFLGFTLLLDELQKAPTRKSAAVSAGYIGFILYAVALAPTFWGVLPLDWFGIGGMWMQLFAVTFSWLFAAAIPALAAAFFGLGAYMVRSEEAPGSIDWKMLIGIPSLWVLSEWLGAFLVGIVGAGPGSLIGAHFTFGALGYLLANDLVFLQAAQWGGIYALSFLVAAVGTLLYAALPMTKKDHLTAILIYSSLILILLLWTTLHLFEFPWDAKEGAAHPLRVAVMSRYVEPKLRPTMEEAESDFQAAYASVEGLRDLDMLVFPEDTAFLRATPDGSHERAFKSLLALGTGSSSPLVIDSDDMRTDTGTLLSRVSFWKGPNDVAYGYKQMFMPFGEYIPYIYRAILTVTGGRQLLDTITEVRGYVPGPEGGVGIVKGAQIAVRFCDEAFSPELYREQAAAGANVLVNLSSQSWFHGSYLIYSQMQNVAKVRAVESGRWFVQSGNMSPAFVLDEHGRVVAETEWNRAEVLQVPVTPQSGKTLYTIMGEKIIFILVLIAGIISALKYWRKKKRYRVHI